MSEKKNNYPQVPSAPTGLPNYEYANNHRGPPPTYEESQKNPYRPPPNYANAPPFGHHHHHQPPMPHYQSQHGSFPPMNSVGYNQGFQQQYSPNYGVVYSQAPQYTGAPQIVQFEAGARFNGKGGGSVSIPPPPPGCMPTSAQLAALQGQPVILKKKKNSFF